MNFGNGSQEMMMGAGAGDLSDNQYYIVCRSSMEAGIKAFFQQRADWTKMGMRAVFDNLFEQLNPESQQRQQQQNGYLGNGGGGMEYYDEEAHYLIHSFPAPAPTQANTWVGVEQVGWNFNDPFPECASQATTVGASTSPVVVVPTSNQPLPQLLNSFQSQEQNHQQLNSVPSHDNSSSSSGVTITEEVESQPEPPVVTLSDDEDELEVVNEIPAKDSQNATVVRDKIQRALAAATAVAVPKTPPLPPPKPVNSSSDGNRKRRRVALDTGMIEKGLLTIDQDTKRINFNIRRILFYYGGTWATADLCTKLSCSDKECLNRHMFISTLAVQCLRAAKASGLIEQDPESGLDELSNGLMNAFGFSQGYWHNMVVSLYRKNE